MLSWFRGQARSISGIALVAFIALTFWSAAPHPDDCHDEACAPLVPHDPSSHSVGRPQGSAEQPLHCVLCHWTRWVRPVADSSVPFTPVLGEEIRLPAVVLGAPSLFSS